MTRVGIGTSNMVGNNSFERNVSCCIFNHVAKVTRYNHANHRCFENWEHCVTALSVTILVYFRKNENFHFWCFLMFCENQLQIFRFWLREKIKVRKFRQTSKPLCFIFFLNSQLFRDSCWVMRKCWEFRLICIHRQNFWTIWTNRDIIETIKRSFCSGFATFGLFCSCFRFFLRLRFFPFLFVRFVSRFASIHRSFPTPLVDSFPISLFPQADDTTNPTRLKKICDLFLSTPLCVVFWHEMEGKVSPRLSRHSGKLWHHDVLDRTY